jgi:hypothetical protein
MPAGFGSDKIISLQTWGEKKKEKEMDQKLRATMIR